MIYALWFQDKFGGDSHHDYWVIQATNSTTGQLVLTIMEVFEQDSTVDLGIVSLNPIYATNTVAPIHEMKYSQEWNILAYSTVAQQSPLSNSFFVYSLSWEPSLLQTVVFELGVADSSKYQISPFLVQSFSFHQVMPLVFLGA